MALSKEREVLSDALQSQEEAPFYGVSPWLLSLWHEFQRHVPEPLFEVNSKVVSMEMRPGDSSMWLSARWAGGGGMLLRTSYSPDAKYEIVSVVSDERSGEWQIVTPIGNYRVSMQLLDVEKSLFHFTVRLTPVKDLKMPFWPVDVFPIDPNWDPFGTRGIVYAGQRGPDAGILFLSLTEPFSGSMLYLQNFTELNDYCNKLQVAPINRVGGDWPELGYTPPLTERKSLEAGEAVVISDAYVSFTTEVPANSQQSGLLFMELLAEIYPHLPKYEMEYHPWPELAEQTIRDLNTSHDCTVARGEQRFLNSYVGTNDRRPESLVQLAVLLPLLEYEKWCGVEVPLAAELRAGLRDFWDEKIGSVLRYRSAERDAEQKDVDEKSAWEIDSWYLYHPMINLARLAKEYGDEEAKDLLIKSLQYGIIVVKHFDYSWPITFRGEGFEVVTAERGPGEVGETDVAGMYAYLMLQAWDITGEERFLEEAEHAAETLKKLTFNIGYQFNNTALGAVALMRLYMITNHQLYLDLSHICLGSVLHNSFLWECNYGWAKHYHTFMGITPLHDADYLAMYEEQELFATFQEYLLVADNLVPSSIRLLLTEYCKYLLDRGWYYYPKSLPKEALAQEVQNGHIDRELAVPLEDLYEGWKKAGQVGQEIYGAGAAFTFISRSYHRLKEAPFIVHCNYPIQQIEQDGSRATFMIIGDSDHYCRLRLIPHVDEPLQKVKLKFSVNGKKEQTELTETKEKHLEFFLPGDCKVEIKW